MPSATLHPILQKAIRRTENDGVTPGGVLLYGDDGQDIETIAFGRSHLDLPFEHQDHTEQPSSGSSGPGDRVSGGGRVEVFDITPGTIYDLASVTKPVATVATLMRLELDLDQPVAPLFPELRSPGTDRITFAHLLGHASGFPAHIEFFRRLLDGDRAGASSPREALLRMVCATELAGPPGQRTVYSDLGYILLGFAIERLTGLRLDDAVRKHVTGPLGMTHTGFIDLDDSSDSAGRGGDQTWRSHAIAPTEVCPYRGLVHGAVHDDNCHAGGGIHGHAGLFSTVGDLARFARAMVRAAAGLHADGGADHDADGGAGFDPDVVRRFLGRSSAPDTTWRLGWDRPSPPPELSNAGSLWPRDGVGHLGYTGTSIWLDPPRGRYVILLTNRVHPSRYPEDWSKQQIRALRAEVMDAVVRTLESDVARR